MLALLALCGGGMVVAANASAPFIIYQCAEYMCTMLALLALCFFEIENFLPFDPLHNNGWQ